MVRTHTHTHLYIIYTNTHIHTGSHYVERRLGPPKQRPDDVTHEPPKGPQLEKQLCVSFCVCVFVCKVKTERARARERRKKEISSTLLMYSRHAHPVALLLLSTKQRETASALYHTPEVDLLSIRGLALDEAFTCIRSMI